MCVQQIKEARLEKEKNKKRKRVTFGSPMHRPQQTKKSRRKKPFLILWFENFQSDLNQLKLQPKPTQTVRDKLG